MLKLYTRNNMYKIGVKCLYIASALKNHVLFIVHVFYNIYFLLGSITCYLLDYSLEENAIFKLN